jgi:hypothetical protein
VGMAAATAIGVALVVAYGSSTSPEPLIVE